MGLRKHEDLRERHGASQAIVAKMSGGNKEGAVDPGRHEDVRERHGASQTIVAKMPGRNKEEAVGPRKHEDLRERWSIPDHCGQDVRRE